MPLPSPPPGQSRPGTQSAMCCSRVGAYRQTGTRRGHRADIVPGRPCGLAADRGRCQRRLTQRPDHLRPLRPRHWSAGCSRTQPDTASSLMVTIPTDSRRGQPAASRAAPGPARSDNISEARPRWADPLPCGCGSAVPRRFRHHRGRDKEVGHRSGGHGSDGTARIRSARTGRAVVGSRGALQSRSCVITDQERRRGHRQRLLRRDPARCQVVALRPPDG